MKIIICTMNILLILSTTNGQQIKHTETELPTILGSELYSIENNIRSDSKFSQDMWDIIESEYKSTTPYEGKLNSVLKRNIRTVKSDFLVNDIEGLGTALHRYPSIGIDATGNFIVTWEDYRNADADIYAQRYNSKGEKQGSNFRVNDDSESANQWSPSIAVDNLGNFIITWLDDRNGNLDVYAQRFNDSGLAEDANFRVNDDTEEINQYSPSVAVGGTGNFAVVWYDQRLGNRDIYIQRLNRDGAIIGENVKVNDDTLNASQDSPAIAADGTGNFVVTWRDRRNGYNDIYAQKFKNVGPPLGINFKVTDDIEDSSPQSPAIAADSAGNFIISWEDYRNYSSAGVDIYAQRFTITGATIGGNFRVNTDSTTAGQYDPSIGINNSGYFIITWVDYLDNTDIYDIYFQCFNTDGSEIGKNNKVVKDSFSESHYNPSVAVDASRKIIIAWEQNNNHFGNTNIYAQQYFSDGIEHNLKFKINDDGFSSYQTASDISVDQCGNFIITWQDGRNIDSDIYAQRFSSTGMELGKNFKINDDSENAAQYTPSIACDSSGNFIIVWDDRRNGTFDDDIYAQRFNSNGMPIGKNFRINDDTGNDAQFSSAIALNNSGSFIIAWSDDRNGYHSDIYIQMYDSVGLPIGINRKINDSVENKSAFSPTVNVDEMGNFLITWTDWRNDNLDIFGQLFDKSGSILGQNFIINNNEGNSRQFHQYSAMNSAGNFIVTWEDERNGDSDIYAQAYNNSGIAQGNNFRVNNDSSYISQSDPSVAVDDEGKFIISWTETWNHNSDIFAQRFDVDGSRIGDKFLITETSHKMQVDPSVKLWNNSIYSAWTSNVNGGTGTDIWANILDWTNPTNINDQNIVEEIDLQEFQLYQNYPNPFNPSTSIKYQLPQSSEVSLKIYNLLGELVRTLVDEKQMAGNYSIKWDGKNYNGKMVSSGIYIYSIHTQDFVKTKKMILIR